MTATTSAAYRDATKTPAFRRRDENLFDNRNTSHLEGTFHTSGSFCRQFLPLFRAHGNYSGSSLKVKGAAFTILQAASTAERRVVKMFTSAIRVLVMLYYRDAATEAGHAKAAHGGGLVADMQGGLGKRRAASGRSLMWGVSPPFNRCGTRGRC
jgi:hypothetical protein